MSSNLCFELVSQLHSLAGISLDASRIRLSGRQPMLPTSFHVGVMAQATIAAAALAAEQVGRVRDQKGYRVSVDLHDAESECTGYFKIDGRVPESWAPLSGLYPCADGFVRIHANFDHHRDAALGLLGLRYSPEVTKTDVIAALSNVPAIEFESMAAKVGAPIYGLRSFDEWDATSHAAWLAEQPLFKMTKLDDAAPRKLPADRVLPLEGLRVLDLTRILAGPTCGRALANYGADVLLVNSPKLPNIEHIADTSRGKRSTLIDLRRAAGIQQLSSLVSDSHVFVQGYRPGGLSDLGFEPRQLAALRPGIVSVSLSAFGDGGSWAERRGFDSLVQTAMGFNHAEAERMGSSSPRPLPVQILDFASGFLMAFATSSALIRQQIEGGSWHVDVSLAQTAQWLRSLGHIDMDHGKVNLEQRLKTQESGFGLLSSIPHAAKFDGQVFPDRHPSMRVGSHEASWW